MAILMVALAGGAGIFGMYKEKASLDEIGLKLLPEIILAESLNAKTFAAALTYRDLLLAPATSARDAARQKIRQSDQHLQQLARELRSLPLTAEEQAKVKQIEDILGKLRNVGERLSLATEQPQTEMPLTLLNELNGLKDQLNILTTSLVMSARNATEMTYDAAVNSYKSA